MDTPAPSPDHPVWGPPRQAPAGAPMSAPSPQRPPTATRRRHPAEKARRIAGWTTFASSVAIVGYMVTANAQSQASQSVTTTPAAPVVVPQSNDDDTPVVSVVTPSVPTLQTVPVARPAAPTNNRQFPQARPNSSSHGS